MKITFGKTYEIRSSFNWKGKIDAYLTQGVYHINFSSAFPEDISLAYILQQKFPKEFTDFCFSTEEGRPIIMFEAISDIVIR